MSSTTAVSKLDNGARLIVHGGAWSIPENQEEAHDSGVHAAAAAAWEGLREGKLTAMDAVEIAVRALETDPTFDAGIGAFLNADGQVELDAMIMDGQDLRFGSVAAVKAALHPVTLARTVLDKTEHHMLVGSNADAFAVSSMPEEELCRDESVFVTGREAALFEKIRNVDEFRKMETSFRPREEIDELCAACEAPKQHVCETPSDTVGCVARDIHGNIAAATSTGGLPRKLPGRVGDAPIVGGGTYCDNLSGGCSATGWGEAIMRVCLAKRVTDALEAAAAVDSKNQNSAHACCDDALKYLSKRVENGAAGVISIDSFGRYGLAFNTEKMATAYAVPGTDRIKSAVLKRDEQVDFRATLE